MFDDILKLPTLRGMMALDYYDEFHMRCDKEYLIKHADAIETILSNPKKLDLTKLATITQNLKDRLTMLPLPDHVFKLASVVFFDQSENPYHFDRKYAAEKVARWKRDPNALGFFLRTPLAELIPFAGLEAVDLHTYSATVEMVDQIHLKKLNDILSPSSVNVTISGGTN